MADQGTLPAREYVASLTGFGDVLRKAGMPVGSGEMLTFCDAVAILDPADLVDVFWAGRTTLVARRQHLATYDRCSGVFPRRVPHARRDAAVDAQARPGPSDRRRRARRGPGPGDEEEGTHMGLMASRVEIWRNKSFAACTKREMAAIRRIMKRSDGAADPPIPADREGAGGLPTGHASPRRCGHSAPPSSTGGDGGGRSDRWS